MQESGPETTVKAIGSGSQNIVGDLGAGVGGSGEGKPDGRQWRSGWKMGMEVAFCKKRGCEGTRGKKG